MLRPGGSFIFLEHVAAEGTLSMYIYKERERCNIECIKLHENLNYFVVADGSLFRRLQKLLDPLQQILADGCHLTRNTRECILEAGFSGGAEIETVSMYSFPWITRPHIYGVAYK